MGPYEGGIGMSEYKGKFFNKHCHECEYLYRDETGRAYCLAYTYGTEECCEIDDFLCFEKKRRNK